MANINATTAALTLTPHTAYINNPQTSDTNFGVLGRERSDIDFGILASQNLFVDQFFGVIGSVVEDSDIDLGVLGKALSEVDAGVIGRALVEAGFGVLADPTPPVVETLAPHLTPDLVMSANVRSRQVYSELHLTYDYDYAQFKYRKGLRFFNTESEARFGKNVLRITSKWLRRNRDAVTFGVSQLKYWSTPQWQVTFTTPADRKIINIGEDIILQHPLVGSDRQYTVLQSEYRIDQLDQFLMVEIPAFDNQTIETSILSEAFDNVIDDIFDASISEGIAEFTLRSPEGKVLDSVSVVVDGGITRRTDGRGRVTFEGLEPGDHLLEVLLGENRELKISFTV